MTTDWTKKYVRITFKVPLNFINLHSVLQFFCARYFLFFFQILLEFTVVKRTCYAMFAMTKNCSHFPAQQEPSQWRS